MSSWSEPGRLDQFQNCFPLRIRSQTGRRSHGCFPPTSGSPAGHQRGGGRPGGHEAEPGSGSGPAGLRADPGHRARELRQGPAGAAEEERAGVRHEGGEEGAGARRRGENRERGY